MLKSLPADIIVPVNQRIFADKFLSLRKQEFKKTCGQKICIHGLWIPWIGKTTKVSEYIRENKNLAGLDFFCIGNDDIMQAIPDYRSAVKTDWPEIAFQQFELTARAIGYELLQEAVKNQVQLHLDHSGTATYRPDLLRELKDVWYRIIMVHIHCSVDEAIRRAKIREKQTWRHVPDSYFPERQKLVDTLKPVYKEIVDEFHTIDNSLPN